MKLTQQEFQSRARAAKTLSHSGNDAGQANCFWNGYIRGLGRNYHGDNFGTAEEHGAWIAAAGFEYMTLKFRGYGYQAGFEGNTIQGAIEIFAEIEGEINTQKSFALRLPRYLYEAIQRRAEAERRSINQQIVFLLEKGVRGEKGQ